ncbi:MAG: HAMP domain-containing histidine kinase [Promicromonosporaceae bacterium]|nr:HAMP domain-containing histidine kinase [Promicromonosporaceae bacterium]
MRVISAVFALTALALAASGAVWYLQARTLTEQRVAASLNQAVELLVSISNEPSDVEETPETLLQTAIQRTQFATGEGAIAFVDGELWWTAPANVVLRPENDFVFLEKITPLTSLMVTSTGTMRTPYHTFRYIVVPVHFDDGEYGAFVQVYDMNVELSPIRALFLRYALTSIGVLILVILLIWTIIDKLLAPVAVLKNTAGSISETNLTERVPIDGYDELAELSVTVNNMLDRVENAVTSSRELLDDVGHELRTPLTIIRGNLEVMNPNDDDDVTATRALVIDEIDRMHRMVEDLLTIAKADQIDFIQTKLVDVAALTDETYQKATALGQRTWQLDDIADISISLDPQRTAQAWLQLITNAVQYSTPNTTIGIGSTVENDQLELWVRDQGIGIEPAEIALIQQRNIRGSSVPRLSPGVDGSYSGRAGLGLHIVNSILQAQGGYLEVQSVPGQGSTFTMHFPLGQPEMAVPSPETRSLRIRKSSTR